MSSSAYYNPAYYNWAYQGQVEYQNCQPTPYQGQFGSYGSRAANPQVVKSDPGILETLLRRGKCEERGYASAPNSEAQPQGQHLGYPYPGNYGAQATSTSPGYDAISADSNACNDDNDGGKTSPEASEHSDQSQMQYDYAWMKSSRSSGEAMGFYFFIYLINPRVNTILQLVLFFSI